MSWGVFQEVLYGSKESMVQVLTMVVVVHVFPNLSPCIAQILSAYVWHINFPFVAFHTSLVYPHIPLCSLDLPCIHS